MRFFLLFLFLPLLGCKGNETEEQKPGQKEQREDLGKLRGYVFTDSEVYSLDLARNKLNQLDSCSRIRDAFLCRDTVWIAGDSLFCLFDDTIVAHFELPYVYQKILKGRAGVYAIAMNNMLRLADRRTLPLSDNLIRARVAFGKIWILDQTGLSIHREADLREELHIPLENPFDFVLTQYGLRVYIAGLDRLNIFDTQSANHIADIKVKIEKQVSLKSVGDKVFCLTRSTLYRIDRIANRVESRLHVNGGKQLFLSRNGKYGAVLRDSVVAFFDVSKEKIVENLQLKAIDIAFTPRDSRVYCLTPEELIVLDPDRLEFIARLELLGGKRIIIK